MNQNKKSEIDREKREFILFLAKTTGAVWLLRFFPVSSFISGMGCSTSSSRETKISYELFPQSVASGDVTQSSVVLWTRTAGDTSPIVLQVSESKDFSSIIFQDVLTPKSDDDFTLKKKIENLSSGKRYYYRFLKDNISSPVGTFKTIEKNPERIRFAFISCQDYSNGFYSAFYHLSQENIDFVVHLGDYIYETISSPTFQYAQLRQFELPSGRKTAYDLNDYRALYKIYRSDRYLQAVHERFPFYIIWDDHEFANDSAQTLSPDNGKDFYNSLYQPERRLYASRAWYEYMPADVYFDPKEQNPLKQIKIYRKFEFGTLMRLIMTDERLYRSEHPCGEGAFGQRYLATNCENINKTTMLGQEQFDWFLKELENSHKDGVIWKIHGNEVCISQMIFVKSDSGQISYLNLDQWDGYAGERQEIFKFIKEKQIKNYVAVTGDLHTFVAGELYDFDPKEKVGVEFTATSITSSNLGSLLRSAELFEQVEKNLVELNRNLKFFNSHYHGYAICEVTRDEIIVEFWRVSSIEEPEVEKTEKILLKKFRVRRDTNTIEDLTP
jgi:alkaline phosphatase D